MECLVRAGIGHLYKIISVGYVSNKKMEEFIDRIDELLNQIKLELSWLIKMREKYESFIFSL